MTGKEELLWGHAIDMEDYDYANSLASTAAQQPPNITEPPVSETTDLADTRELDSN